MLKKIIAPLWSKGILAFAVIVLIFNTFMALYIKGYEAWLMVLATEAIGIIAYTIAMNIPNHSDNFWVKNKEE